MTVTTFRDSAVLLDENNKPLRPVTNEEKVLITQSVREVNQIMANYVGIVRSDLRLHRAWDRLDMLYEETERLFKRVKASRDICELRNMINVGYLITRWALERKECRGLHYAYYRSFLLRFRNHWVIS